MFEEKTQLIREIFPDCSEEKIKEILEKFNITIPDNFRVSNKMNIVIGSNGSGKTRFLKAIKEIYELDNSARIMYGYHPSLSDKFCPCTNGELPDFSFYELLYSESATFEDLLKAIELYGPQFISELLLYRSKKEKEYNNEIINQLNADFCKLTGKSIVKQENMIRIMEKDGVLKTIEDALTQFSPGEIMLFYMSIFLAIQKNSINIKRVIILDEPECHLHPKALIEFIKTLVENHKSETIWIATHSLFLIPEFNFENIIYIKDSEIVKRKSTIYRDLISGVLGDAKKTEDFFSSLSKWQYCEFIAECFANPKVIDMSNPEDEQIQLFVRFLQSFKAKEDVELKVLDFGGGSARLGKSLKLIDKIANNISYEIYDPYIENYNAEFILYENLEYISNKYDCVVMMNVLHEIEPSKWKKTFSDVCSLINDNGYLIFVEVSALSVGEMPNKTGYMVLGKDELELLFNNKKCIAEIRIKEKQKSICYAIKKSELTNVTNTNINNAILFLQHHSYEELKKIRKNDVSKTKEIINDIDMRKYAFWTQQYINAKLYNDRNIENKYSKKKSVSLYKKSLSVNEKIEEVRHLLDDEIIVGDTNHIVRSIRSELERGMVFFDVFGCIIGKETSSYWDNILSLEKENYNKRVIANFLKVGALMGDERCEKKFYGYSKYI